MGGFWLLVVMLEPAVCSYLVVRYAEGNKVAMSVGFYYMANAGGRLVGGTPKHLSTNLSYYHGTCMENWCTKRFAWFPTLNNTGGDY